MGQEARPTELGFVWYFRRQGFHAAGIVAIGGELLEVRGVCGFWHLVIPSLSGSHGGKFQSEIRSGQVMGRNGVIFLNRRGPADWGGGRIEGALPPSTGEPPS